jgi:threonine/homoserine/homoserine lactone efflux protein
MTGLSLSGLLIFAAALFVAAFSPGPGIAAILARVLGRGRNGAVAFVAGMAIGDVVWLSFAVLGLAVLAQSFHEIFTVIKYAGAAYLLYVAFKMWTAPAIPPELVSDRRPESRLKLFAGGLAVTMGNPKTMVFTWRCCPISST